MTATWRDLAEAQAYERRRVMAAYLSGSPEGPLVAPPGTGRALLLGVLVAVVLVVAPLVVERW
ncbi:MAG TPA: hypothetical protein VGE38_14825 [Nocardioides sp.]|uniref:hypothetical protein n=1 Tax=Nocardioides sp. TaxID=35761 RepID=UPI002ED848A1